ncbi:MAG TPA: nucleoside recognition protein [Thermoanaerobacterales bacterium]|nr:nucleoside recognition protein [Thermoanaerobacterales bacterium]
MQNQSRGLSVDTFKRGLLSGLNVTYQLCKIVVPIYFIVTFLKHTPVIKWISVLFAPIMGIFGLPGEAAIALVLGNIVNLYAAIGAIASLTLSVREISILAIMLCFCHSLLVESVLAKRIGLPIINSITVRVFLAIVSGIAFNLLL